MNVFGPLQSWILVEYQTLKLFANFQWTWIKQVVLYYILYYIDMEKTLEITVSKFIKRYIVFLFIHHKPISQLLENNFTRFVLNHFFVTTKLQCHYLCHENNMRIRSIHRNPDKRSCQKDDVIHWTLAKWLLTSPYIPKSLRRKGFHNLNVPVTELQIRVFLKKNNDNAFQHYELRENEKKLGKKLGNSKQIDIHYIEVIPIKVASLLIDLLKLFCYISYLWKL